MADTKLVNLGAIGTPALEDLLYVVDDPSGTPVSNKMTLTQLKTLLGGQVVQAVNVQTGAVATGTTIIPMDDTIPQNAEGDEYMTLAITPTNTAHKLRIDVVINIANGTNARYQIAALFQDTTADALAAVSHFSATGGEIVNLKFTHYMTAGTTSATTFKVRAGGHAAGTTTFNGHTAARKFGGVSASSITITEIRP